MERKWWTLLASCIAIFMLLVDVTIVNVALPSIERDEGGLLESTIGKEIHYEQAYRALGGEGFDGYFPAYRCSV